MEEDVDVDEAADEDECEIASPPPMLLECVVWWFVTPFVMAVVVVVVVVVEADDGENLGVTEIFLDFSFWDVGYLTVAVNLEDDEED